MNVLQNSSFLSFWSLGYRRLVPIIPPTAEISERSSLHKRVGTKQDPRGKAVGVKRNDGRWSGFDWVPYESDEHDIERWQRMGAGVGIKTGALGTAEGHSLIAIDADTLDDDHARAIRDTIEEMFGRLPVRVGNYPKALYLCRTSEPIQYQRIDFGERDERGVPERVEILSDGRQFVAHGVHPKTGNPYHWPRSIVPLDELPTVEPAAIPKLLETLRHKLPQASELIREGATTNVNQDSLRGNPEHVRRAVEAIPNTSEHFPTRESYRDFGYAIKAALPDDEATAFHIFSDWCDRWADGDNDPEIVEADWRRMKPPYRRGAGWLYELAERHAPEKFDSAAIWFEPIETSSNPFAELQQAALNSEPTDTYQLVTIDQLFERPPPVWLIERHIPEKSVGFVYSEPGAGKTFIVLDMALSVAHGLPQWHGDAINTNQHPAVIYIAAEGSFDMGQRIKAWLNRRGLSDRLSKSFLLIEQPVNFMNVDDVKKLLRTLLSVRHTHGLRPCLVVVDTVSRALPGADENSQKDMTLFVRACDAVRDQEQCAVIGIHHASKGAGDMRGSTVLQGAGDFVFRLARKKGATIGELTCEKQKAAPDGWHDNYRLDAVPVGDGEAAGSSLVVERVESGVGPSVELTPDVAERVLGAMRAAWGEGSPWSRAPQSRERYAVRRMVADFGFDGAKAESLLEIWLQTGVVSFETADAKRHIKGLKVLAAPGQSVLNDGIFG